MGAEIESKLNLKLKPERCSWVRIVVRAPDCKNRNYPNSQMGYTCWKYLSQKMQDSLTPKLLNKHVLLG